MATNGVQCLLNTKMELNHRQSSKQMIKKNTRRTQIHTHPLVVGVILFQLLFDAVIFLLKYKCALVVLPNVMHHVRRPFPTAFPIGFYCFLPHFFIRFHQEYRRLHIFNFRKEGFELVLMQIAGDGICSQTDTQY